LSYSTPSIELSEKSSFLSVEEENQFNIIDNDNFKISKNKNNYFILSFILEYLLISEKEVNINVDPFILLYSQRNINPWFQNGLSIDDTINNLISGVITPDDIEPIKVCIINDYLYTLDNRRLYSFQQAILRGAKFSKVPCIVIHLDDPINNIEMKLSESLYYNEKGKLVQNKDWTKIHNISYKARYENYF
jgi:hypothetical protein